MQYHKMGDFAAKLICLVTCFGKKPMVSIGIEILGTTKYQQVIAYLRMVLCQFASITES